MDVRRHAGVEGDTVVVNMAIASSHASVYQKCVEKAGQSGKKYPAILGFYYSFSLVPVQLQTCSITRKGSK